MLNSALQFVKKTFDVMANDELFGYIKLQDGIFSQLALEEKGGKADLKSEFLKKEIDSQLIKFDHHHNNQNSVLKKAIGQAARWQDKVTGK